MPPTSIRLPAPAKLNLFLHITGRRADGYHELQTLFQLLDWGDTVELEALTTGEIKLGSELPGVPPSDNIALKAAIKLKQEYGCPDNGVAIHIDKQIPMGGGLGGGSSDAASTLLGLNHLWELGLSLDELAALGVRLGADVPVFIRGQNCLAEGIGEIFTAVELPESCYLIIKPAVNVETATIFGHPQLTRGTLPIRIPAFFEAGSRRLRQDLFQGDNNASSGNARIVLKNDCEALAAKLYPEIAEVIDWLEGQPETGQARMTGTGACVFSQLADQESAGRVLERLPSRWQGFVSQSSNRSSAHRALDLL